MSEAFNFGRIAHASSFSSSRLSGLFVVVVASTGVFLFVLLVTRYL